MSDVLGMAEMISDTGATLAVVERALAADPMSLALRSSLRSLQERQSNLAEDFARMTYEAGVDVCSYRLFGDDNHPGAAALARALGAFQSLVSVVYAAVASGERRATTRVSADVSDATTFRFGYSFPGSVGFALTLPNERLLMGASKLDESMDVVFSLAQALSTEDIRAFARRLGPAPVREMYRWSSTHAVSNLGAEIRWRMGATTKSGLFLQPPEFEHLRATIEATSEATEEEVPLAGMLVGLDTVRRSFHMQFPGGDDLRGALSDNLALTEPARIPAHYRVWLTKTTRTQYSMDMDEVTWELTRLELS